MELLAKTKELYPKMIRIILSGHAEIEVILNAVNQLGIDRYLIKPWRIEDVLLAIRQSIEIYDLRQEVSELRKMLGK